VFQTVRLEVEVADSLPNKEVQMIWSWFLGSVATVLLLLVLSAVVVTRHLTKWPTDLKR
jgi:hypothetical protein